MAVTGCSNRSRKAYDSLLELRDVADGAEVATAAETGIAFDAIHAGDYVAVIFVTAIDATSANETYVITLEVSDTVSGTYTAIATLPNIRDTGTGIYEVPLGGDLTTKLDSDAAFIRVQATISGTSPSITYGAYLAKK